MPSFPKCAKPHEVSVDGGIDALSARRLTCVGLSSRALSANEIALKALTRSTAVFAGTFSCLSGHGSPTSYKPSRRPVRHKRSSPRRYHNWRRFCSASVSVRTLTAAALALFVASPNVLSAAAIERDHDPLAARTMRAPNNQSAAAVYLDSVSADSASDAAAKSGMAPSSSPALLPEGMPPRLLISFMASNGEARQRAEGLEKLLASQGLEVSDVRESVVLSRTQITYYYASDQAMAESVARVAGLMPTRAALPRDGLTIRPGTIQIGISGR